MNVNHKIINYVFPEKICLECDNSLVEKSLIFNKKMEIELCDYHKTIKNFSNQLKQTRVIDQELEYLFSDNSNSFHNTLKIKDEVFKEIVTTILHKNQIYKYHFCCDGNGVMYYQ